MQETRRLLELAGRIDPVSAAEYEAAGGYTGLRKALASPETICEVMKASGLRGRGGAGFPVGIKWITTRDAVSDQKYVICNADEGEPGTNKDRVLLSEVPLTVLEGMTIAGIAVGADKGYLYLRAEYPYVRDILKKALENARAAGFLGEDILGSGRDFDIEVRCGQGAYVCGEETALMESLEGHRGEPRKRPPLPALQGLWGKPTVINNVESMANVPWIMAHGAEAFREYGTERCPGTKLFTLSGNITHPGVYEFPLGTSMRRLYEEVGGGCPDGKALKAIQTGGESGPVVGVDRLDTPMDIESCAAAGCSLGAGDLLFLDEDVDLADFGRNIVAFYAGESCGKCVPCRLGTREMVKLWTILCERRGDEDTLLEIEDLADYLKMNSFCGLGQAVPTPVLALLQNFRGELIGRA